MQSSSLIFLVIVAIWAAYLVQHWVRRREHVATARSVDRFSEAMRVLERRRPLPSSELSAPRPHSYAVKPASSRPAVTVKRAVAAGAEPRGIRATAGRLARSTSAVLLRRVRGVCFLLTLGAVPVTVALSALHLLLWVSVAISVGAFAAVLGWLRTSVVRERAARAASSRSRGTARAASRNAGDRAWRGVAGPASGKVATHTGAPSADDRVPATAQTPVVPAHSDREVARAAVFDVDAPPVTHDAFRTTDEVAVVVDQQVSVEAGLPGGWSPVPVPPPTYTLKDTATRRRPGPAETTQTPVPIEVEDDDIERMAAEHHRRVVGG